MTISSSGLQLGGLGEGERARLAEQAEREHKHKEFREDGGGRGLRVRILSRRAALAAAVVN